MYIYKIYTEEPLHFDYPLPTANELVHREKHMADTEVYKVPMHCLSTNSVSQHNGKTSGFIRFR